MLLEIKVPELQKSTDEITEGMACPISPELRMIKLVTWYVKNGDYINKDAALCMLETSKASFEIPAEKDGYVKIVTEEGALVSSGEVLCIIADSLEELAI